MFKNGIQYLFRNSLAALMILLYAIPLQAQETKHKVVGVIDGDPLYQIYAAGVIPSIDEPVFISGEEAQAQMDDDEPVLGLLLEDEARAYSLWQLDRFEIVNDSKGDSLFAVTW